MNHALPPALRSAFTVALIALLFETMGLPAGEFRVPLDGIRSYDSSQNWHLDHEDAYPMAGAVPDSLAEFSTSVWFRIEKLPLSQPKEQRHMAAVFSRGWSQELRISPEGDLYNFYCMTHREAI